MRPPHLTLAVVLGVCLVEAACFPDYFPRQQLREHVADQQMIGRWQLTTDSAKMLARYRVPVTSKESTIEFSSDHRCQLRNFVDEYSLVSGAGTWKIEYRPEFDSEPKISLLQVGFQTAERPITSTLYFTHKRRKLVLWQYHSDPDAREYIEYER
jgi:hypothetical protein